MLGISVKITLALLGFSTSDRAVNSALGGSNVCLSRTFKASSDPRTYESRNLRLSAQVLARLAKFD